MTYDPGALEAALAAAVGGETALIDDLRGAFLTSADAYRKAIERASSVPDRNDPARRLKGLAASFDAVGVMRAADALMTAELGDAKALRRVERAIAFIRDEGGTTNA